MQKTCLPLLLVPADGVLVRCEPLRLFLCSSVFAPRQVLKAPLHNPPESAVIQNRSELFCSPPFGAVLLKCLRAPYSLCPCTPSPSPEEACFQFASPAISQITSPCDSNLVRPLHTCSGYLLGSAALQPI